VAALLGKTFPDQFTSRYEMVSFSNLPYTEAVKRGAVNDQVIEEVAQGIAGFDLAQFDATRAKAVLDKYFPPK